MDQEFIGRFHNAYTEWLGGKPRALLELLSPTVVYHLSGKHLGGGILREPSAILRRASMALTVLQGPPQVELVSVACQEPFVTTLERFRALRSTAALDQIVCVVWRFDGPVCVEVWSHFSDQAACDDFWKGFDPEDR